MSEAVRETACTSCKHREVCKYKENYLKVCEAASNINVTLKEHYEDGVRARIIPVANFDCIKDIEISCKFYVPKEPITCTSAATEKRGEWDYWAGWCSNHDLRLEDATCPFCGYIHPVIRYDRQAPKKLPNQCPNCNAFLDIHAEDK